MAMDGVSDKEVEVIPLQNVPEAISEIGSLVQLAGAADIVDTVIILTLTKKEGKLEPVLEVMFAGKVEQMKPMMRQGSEIVGSIVKDTTHLVHEADEKSASDPWNYI